MKQHVVHDQVAVRYADGIDRVWTTWEPALRRSERLLGGASWRGGLSADEVATELRRAQYRAHTGAEFAAGLVPPPSVADAHAFLLGALAQCRDALGVLALRAELDELDDDTAEIGLHAVFVTRDAFAGARSTTALVHAWVAEDQVGPSWVEDAPPGGRALPAIIWTLAATSVVLFVALLVQAFVLGNPA